MTRVERKQQLIDLIERAKDLGYLTFSDVNDVLPDDIEEDQLGQVLTILRDFGIQLFESAPDSDELLTKEGETFDDAAAEARFWHWRKSMPNSVVPPIRCVCTCAKWGRSNS